MNARMPSSSILRLKLHSPKAYVEVEEDTHKKHPEVPGPPSRQVSVYVERKELEGHDAIEIAAHSAHDRKQVLSPVELFVPRSVLGGIALLSPRRTCLLILVPAYTR